MALPLTETDKFLLLSAVGAPETRDRIAALLDLAGTGNMTGPASATDNAVVRFDGSTGALVQNSGILLDDSNNLSGIALLSAASANLSGLTASRVLQTDASKNLQSSTVTTATLAFLDATSSVQTQLNSKAPTANPSFTGQIFNASGTPSLPSYSFTSDTDTGIFRTGPNELGLAAAGSEGFRVTASSVVAFLPFYAADGSAGAPGITFNADTNTGIYRAGIDEMHFVAGGVSKGSVRTDGIHISRGLFEDGTAASPSISFESDIDTGIYRINTNILGISTNGTLGVSINASQLVTIGASGGTQTHVINGGIDTSQASLIAGSTTNDAAAAGDVGETLTISNTTDNSLTNSSVFSLGSVSITAGDWDVWGIASFSGTGATSTFTVAGIGTTNTTLGTNGNGTKGQINQNLASQDSNFTVGPFRLSLASPTTYFFNIRCDFSAGTVTGKGTLYARRRR